MRRYLKAKNARYRKAQGSRNDCSVIAISIVCRTTYKAAFIACEKVGRKPKGGLSSIYIGFVAKSLGFNLEVIAGLKQKNGSNYTAKTIGDKLKKGYYLVFTSDHVFAVVNGDVEDWTKNRKHTVTDVYKVIRLRAR